MSEIVIGRAGALFVSGILIIEAGVKTGRAGVLLIIGC
jgi:hypothetical protein